MREARPPVLTKIPIGGVRPRSVLHAAVVRPGWLRGECTLCPSDEEDGRRSQEGCEEGGGSRRGSYNSVDSNDNDDSDDSNGSNKNNGRADCDGVRQ